MELKFKKCSLTILIYWKYLDEFKIINGFLEHKDGLDFYSWLYKYNFISAKTFTRHYENMDFERDFDSVHNFESIHNFIKKQLNLP